MNIPMSVINVWMILGGMGMLGYVLWFILDEIFDRRRDLRVFGQVILVIAFMGVGFFLATFGLGLK